MWRLGRMQQLSRLCLPLCPRCAWKPATGYRNYMDRHPPARTWLTTFGMVAAASLGTGWLYAQLTKQATSRPDDLPDLVTTSGGRSTDLHECRLRDRFNFINKVVERCAPAVVYVEIREPRKMDGSTGDHPAIMSNGSGFIVSADGWIITNAHVVVHRPNAVVHVKLPSGQVYPATVEHADMNIDLALMKIHATEKLPSLALARSGDVAVGEWVVALGSPLSLSHSASAGVVSCVNRHAGELGLQNFKMRYIQTDAPITFGNSGGPLVNLDGEVIGINNLRITAGISFAIPVEFIEQFLEGIRLSRSRRAEGLQSGNVLGVAAIAMQPEIADDVASKFHVMAKDGHGGVLLWKVLGSGAGAKAGLLVGDVVTHVDGEVVSTGSEMFRRLAAGGQPHTLTLLRNGKSVSVRVAG